MHDIIMADRRVTEHYIATELMHPCSHPQQTSCVQNVSTSCPKAPWTSFETDSAQHVEGKFRWIPTVLFRNL